jgi:TfoX/Sxy family transcriptional regulator of competence genes
MAYNERLAERVREALAGQRGITERKMFGGLAFLAAGKMCVGVLGDELVVRSGAERHADAPRKPHTRPMDFTGRAMTGMVYVSPVGVSRGASLRRWVELGLAGAREAKPSRRRTSKK